MGFLDRHFRRRSSRPDLQRILDALQDFIRAPTWAEARRILEQHPELLDDLADAMLSAPAQALQDPQARQLLERHRAFLRRCREVGIDAALGEVSPSTDQPLLGAIQEFVAAQDSRECRRILARHPELLSDRADAFLERLAPVQKTPLARQWVEKRRTLLRRCREVGIDAAFGKNPSSSGARERTPKGQSNSIHPAFEADLRRATEEEERYRQSSDVHALDEAVTAYERILHNPDFAASEPSFQLTVLNYAGGLYLDRYRAAGNFEDLNLALEVCRRVVEETPPGSPELAGRLNNLGAGLCYRYAVTGDLADLDGAIRALEQAVEHTPRGSPTLPARLSNLGVGLRDRYARTGDLADLDGAIRALERAVKHTPRGSPALPARLSNLGLGLRDRYAQTGDLTELEGAVRAFEQAVKKTPPGWPELAGLLNNLGLGLRDRYARTGNLTDLEGAVRAFEQAVEETPPGAPLLPRAMTNLGLGLRERYARTGDLTDLEGAVRAFEQAVKKTPPGSPELAALLNNLGLGLRDRYGQTGDLTDLEGAVRALEQAARKTPPGSPDLPRHVNALGLGLRDRYARTGNPTDLEGAVRAFEQAARKTPPGSPELAVLLSNLGAGLYERYSQTSDLADLEGVIRTFEQADKQTSPGSPYLPAVLYNLGTGLRDRYAQTRELADLKEAIDVWERAWSFLQTTFVAAPVAYKLGQQRQWAGLYAALVTTHLQRAETRPLEATAARRRAMEVVEGSKSRLLTELVGRGDLPAPPTIPAKQAARERQVADALTLLDTAELATHGRPGTAGGGGRLESLEQRKRHLQELKDLWKEMAQSGPEAEDYVALRRGDPPGWEELVGLAGELGSESALLSLFTDGDRTLLFVVRQGWGEPAVVEADVDSRTWADIARRFVREIHGYDGTGRRGETWDGFLRPLMEKASGHLGGVRRIIFAPEARGHLLPWSVVAWRAGLREPDGLAVPLVTLPALGILPRLRRRPAGRGSGALVVGNPLKGDPRQDLRYAEHEAQEVAGMLGTEPLIGHQATKEAVLEGLSGASVVHLATHAGFVPGSPLDSGIVLADGILTAREVMSHRLQADLMVLSACQTGMAEALAGDELAGLAQAFLQAGARSLVVSLWTVNDPATAALMSAFYGARSAGADKALALSQAMGKVQKKKGWSHPYYWGAFVLMGDWA